MSSRRRLVLVLALAFAFGLAAGWIKGQDTDGLSTISQVRSSLGNLSTPWLLVAFVAGTRGSRIRSGALLGFLATVAALAGFYLLTTLVIDLGGHGFLADLRKELAANRGYFEGGFLTGPLFGALGAWWQRTRSLRASVLAGGLMMAEPLVLAGLGAVFSGGVLSASSLPMVVRIIPGWSLSADSSGISIAVYAAEFGLGLAVLVDGVRRSRRLQPARAD